MTDLEEAKPVRSKYASNTIYYATADQLSDVLDMMKGGAYMSEVARYFDITRTGLYERMKRDPKLLDTINKGKDFSLAWHEENGRLGLFNKEFNATLFFMIMRNKHGWHNQQYEQQQDNGVAITGDTIAERIRNLSDRVSKKEISLTSASKQLKFLEAELNVETLDRLENLQERLDATDSKK